MTSALRKLELRIGRLRLPIYTVIFFWFLLASGGGLFLLVGLICAMIHEVGHIAAAKICRAEVLSLTVYPCGADMRLGGGVRGYLSEAFISGGGAMANVFTAIILLIVGGFVASEVVSYAVFCSMSLAFLNLIPIRGLDGGNILKYMLLMRLDGKTVDGVLCFISWGMLFFLWIAAAYILLLCHGSPSLFFMVCGVFVFNFAREK